MKETKNKSLEPDFSPYWTFEHPRPQSPIFCWAPSVAFERLVNLSKVSLGLQRKHTQKFRRELALTSRHPNSAKLVANNSYDQLIANLQGQGPKADLIINMCGKFADLDLSQKCNLIYVLLSAGFFNEAVQLLKSVSLVTPRLAVLNWLSRDLQNYGLPGTVGSEGLDLLQSIPKTSQNIRCRFNIYLQLVVYFAQRKDFPVVSQLKQLGPEILKSVGFSDESPFAMEIMRSKFHRSFSYVAFLEKDLEELQRQNHLIEIHAMAALPVNPTEEIICKENVFPMLESTARIFSYLGQRDEALSRLTRIASEIDSYLGMSDLAYASYLRAAECVMPHAHIISFKIGSLLEARGDIQAALTYYLDSLKSEPNGFSPLLGVYRLSDTLGQTREFRKAEQALNGLLEAGTIGLTQRKQINEILKFERPKIEICL
jgi:tetratricopeptide (TPR) repeat protein